MKPWQTKFITENKYELCKLINLEGEGALTALESHILSGEDVDLVKIALQSKGRVAGSSKLLDLLMTRTNAYEWLIYVLKMLGQTKAYELLERGQLLNEPGVFPQQSGVFLQPGVFYQPSGVFPQQSGVFPQQPGVCPHQSGVFPHQSGVFPQQPVFPQQSGVFPQQPGVFPQQSGVFPQHVETEQGGTSNPNSQHRQADPSSGGKVAEFEGDVLDGIVEVDVTRPKKKMAFADDGYDLPPTGKGLALLVNVINFDNPIYNIRTSARQDSKNLTDLFRQLGYEVYNDNGVLGKESWTDEEIRNVVLAFQKRCNKENVKSILIYIGTHGVHEKLLSSNDQTVVYWKDIISKFNTEACPKLEKKPKLFIIQACQIFAPDSQGGKREEVDDIKRKMNHYALIQSTIPGEYSYRIDGVGAVMVHFLTKFLMQKAHSNKFQDIIRMVDRKVARSCNRQTLRMELERLAPLYFNLDPEDD